MQIGDKRGEGVNFGSLGNVYYNLGNYEKSISYYKQAVDISKQIGDKRGEGINLGNLGDVFSKLERWKEAEQSLCAAVECCKTTITAAAGAFSGAGGTVLLDNLVVGASEG